MNLDAFETHAEEYDEWFERNILAYASELEALKRVVPENGKGLEIGVGTGRFASPLNIFVGIDPSLNMLKIAQKRGVRVVLGYGENLPFRLGEFDWVLINTTLCFVSSPEKVLKEAKRTMNRDAKIIIGIIDRESYLGRYYRDRGGIFYEKANLYSGEEVIELLGVFGFKDLRVYQTIFRPPDQIKEPDEVRNGYGEGGFVVISGGIKW